MDIFSKIIAKLDTSHIKQDYEAVVQWLNRSTIHLKTVLDFAEQDKKISAFQSQLDSIQFSIDTEKYSSEIFKLQQELKNFSSNNGKLFDDATASLAQMEHAYDNLKSSSGNKRLEHEEAYQKALSKTNNLLTQLSSISDNEVIPPGDERRIHLINTLNEYLNKNSKMNQINKNSISQWITSLSSADDMSRGSIREIISALNEMDSKLESTGQTGLSMGDKLSQIWTKMGDWGFTLEWSSNLSSAVKQALSDLAEVDTCLTKISQENENLSKKRLTEMGDLAFETAGKYGQSAVEYLSQVQSLLQAGYGNAEELAELSLAAQTAGSMTSDLTNEYLLAADQAYGLQGNVTKLTQALDGADTIANQHTVTMTELTQGISAVSSMAADSQMSIAETTAAIGTLVSVTHEGGAEMGDAFQGILMLLQQITGTAGGNAIDTSNLEQYKKACEDLGVSMTTVKNGTVSLKEPMKLLQELSEAYTELDASDSKRANLLDATGDTSRADALNALLENYGLYEQMLKEYAVGKGSIAADAEKTANSWENSLNRLSNTWTDTISNLVEPSIASTFLNILNSVLSLINAITSLIDVIPSGAGILGSFLLGKKGLD